MNIAPSNNGSTEFLNFSDALHHLRWGERIARRSWTGNTWMQAVYGEGAAFLEKRSHPGGRIRTSMGGADLMAEDWYVL